MSRDAMVKVEDKQVTLLHEIDRALRRIAVAHSALDADELHWLRVAEDAKAWPKLGYVHGLEYLEDVFGYAPRTAMERLRVARELGELPQLEDELRCGEMSFSVVRELTRVATAENIDAWMEKVRGRRLRDVEQMVSGRKKGDGPDATPDPNRVRHRVMLELDAESLAIWRQMQQAIELDDGHKLDDRCFVLALGTRILHDDPLRTDAGVNSDAHLHAEEVAELESADSNAEDPGAAAASSFETSAAANANTESAKAAKPTLRSVLARYMIHITTCRDCKRGWQDGAGVRVEIDPTVIDRAQCNAIICDDENGKRSSRTIPAHIERQVLERAQHRCEVPGCRSSKHLTIHHIVFWSQGGTHDLWNLIVLCDGHHRVLHDGLLTITGHAPDELVFKRNGEQLRGRDDAAATERTNAAIAGRNGHALPRHALAKSTRANKSVKQAMTAPNIEIDDPIVLAQAALRQLGFKATTAAQAVEAATAHVGANVELGVLIKEALRHCS